MNKSLIKNSIRSVKVQEALSKFFASQNRRPKRAVSAYYVLKLKPYESYGTRKEHDEEVKAFIKSLQVGHMRHGEVDSGRIGRGITR